MLALSATMLLSAVPMVAQDCNNEEQVVKVDARASQFSYRENEVIVKFKPVGAVQMRANAKGGFATSGVSRIDAVMNELGVESFDGLMPLTGKEVKRRSARAINGTEVVAQDLSKLYRVRFDAKKVASVEDAVAKLQALDEVEFAEPNYLVYTTAKDDDDLIYTDPLHGEQWGINAVNLRKLWKVEPITDERPIIGILDTGVEITHPDLADNAWVNEQELNGVEGVDDDGNGFVDDIHGYDFINLTGEVNDFNGHGTHCAGIAAAMAGNEKGGVGANPNALIMSITVMQSDGVGDVATIIKGVDYASANGVDVLSMSIGTYATSIAFEQALGKAYQKAVLVAAAGNDGQCIYTHICTHPTSGSARYGAPMFPAAYTFVLGVQATESSGMLTSFSNYDHDGPIFSDYGEVQLYNYELMAPGKLIMSTYRGGSYKALNGTSMACPIVAGGISRLLQCKEYASKELLFGDLIHAADGGMVDFYATYQISDEDRRPTLGLITYELNDTTGGDGDMRADAGEVIAFYPSLRNHWGLAENVKISLELAENEDPTIVEFIDNNVDFGWNLSSYAKGKATNPIRFKLRDNCVDGRHICLVFRATCNNIQEELVQEFVITAENGVEIGGMITEDLTLYPNVHYIVTKALAVPDSVKLTIKPGTIVKFKANTGISFATGAKLDCVGKPDSMIVFTMADHETGTIEGINFECIRSYLNKLSDKIFSYTIFKNLKITQGYSSGGAHITSNFKLNNCVFENCVGNVYNCISESCVLKNNLSPQLFHISSIDNVNGTQIKYNNYIRYNNFVNNSSSSHSHTTTPIKFEYVSHCNIFSNDNSNYGHELYNICFDSKSPKVYQDTTHYYGTSREDIAREGIFDMENPYFPIGYGKVDLSNMATRPYAEAHGIVWKVVVNGYDAQDEYELLPPLGVGKHKFEVYFNRPMNKDVVPTIAMGVRPPYTQNAISEDGSWNEEGTIYTAYLTLTGKSATDGVNRIYVAEAEDDEYFEIPIENWRFNVDVQVAGSMSTGLMAEAGLGKVKLTWETDEEDYEDLMGYNIHRYVMINDSVSSNTIVINKNLIDIREQEFTDYDVVPGTTYYYTIKQMTTSLTSHALSNVVAATPLTASKGDANGSMSVDVADVVTEVAYMTEQDPQPFIFEAADVITDNEINVLDVVGTVNIIKNPTSVSASSVGSSAVYTIEDDILYVDSDVALGGVQFRFNVGEGDEIIPLEALDGFEQVSDNQGEKGYLFFAFSMSGKSLLPGKHALLQIGHAQIVEVVLSDVRGNNIVGINGNLNSVGTIETMQMELPYPNPFDDTFTIPYKVGKEGNHEVKIVVTNVAGSTIAMHTATAEYGYHNWQWTPGDRVEQGVYFVSLYVDDVLMQTAKAVKR